MTDSEATPKTREIDKIAKHAEDETKTLILLKRNAGIASTIVLPIIIALWAGFYDEIRSIDNGFFWIGLVFLAFVQLLFALSFGTRPQLAQVSYFEARKIHNDNRVLKEQARSKDELIRYMSILEACCRSWRTMERSYKGQSLDSKESLTNMFSEMLAVLLDKRDSVFGTSSSEHWNFVVYLYDDSVQKLKPVWREKHPSHSSRGMGREWGQGQGHVGSAFADKRTKVTGDATQPDVESLMAPPDDMALNYDSAEYKSFVSSPIGPVNSDDTLPFGVLVTTSNYVGRFNKGNALIIKHAAGALANVIHLNHIKYSVMFGDTAKEG